MTAPKSIDQLRAALAAAEAAQAAQDAADAARLAAAQDEWRRALVARGADLDRRLEEEWREHFTTAETAARVGDLPAAYLAYREALRSRQTRYTVRNAVQGAAAALGVEPYTNAELRLIEQSFGEWLTEQTSRYSGAAGYDVAQELTGTMPTTLADLA